MRACGRPSCVRSLTNKAVSECGTAMVGRSETNIKSVLNEITFDVTQPWASSTEGPGTRQGSGFRVGPPCTTNPPLLIQGLAGFRVQGWSPAACSLHCKPGGNILHGIWGHVLRMWGHAFHGIWVVYFMAYGGVLQCA